MGFSGDREIDDREGQVEGFFLRLDPVNKKRYVPQPLVARGNPVVPGVEHVYHLGAVDEDVLALGALEEFGAVGFERLQFLLEGKRGIGHELRVQGVVTGDED
jgi:hypothetical protein